MKFIVEKPIFEKFPELNLAVLIVKDIDNTGINVGIVKLLEEKCDEIRQIFNSETLQQNPKIDCWRKAYLSFGAKPKEHLSSVENLHRIVLKGVNIKHINKLVDIYNLISLKHMVPVGGEDLDKIQGYIKLTIAEPNEKPVLLLGDKDTRKPHGGEVIYKDSLSAICRRFNWREVDRTKFTEQTKNAVLIAEVLPPLTKQDIEKIATDMKHMVQKYCGGEISFFVLNKKNPEIEWG